MTINYPPTFPCKVSVDRSMQNNGLVVFKDGHISYMYASQMLDNDKFNKKYHVRDLWWEKQVIQNYSLQIDSFEQFLVPHLRIVVMVPGKFDHNFQIFLPSSELERIQSDQVEIKKGALFVYDYGSPYIFVFGDWFQYQKFYKFDVHNLKWLPICDIDKDLKIKPTGGFIDQQHENVYLFSEYRIIKYGIENDHWEDVISTNFEIMKDTVLLSMWNHNLDLATIPNDNLLVFHYKQKDVFKFDPTTSKFSEVSKIEKPFGQKEKAVPVFIDVYNKFCVKPEILGENLYVVTDELINVINLKSWSKNIRNRAGYIYA